jgi:hypothetical protein
MAQRVQYRPLRNGPEKFDDVDLRHGMLIRHLPPFVDPTSVETKDIGHYLAVVGVEGRNPQVWKINANPVYFDIMSTPLSNEGLSASALEHMLQPGYRTWVLGSFSPFPVAYFGIEVGNERKIIVYPEQKLQLAKKALTDYLDSMRPKKA